MLLTVAGFYGTLAATRAVGRAGIPVIMADSRLLAPARWSRFVARRERCPPVEQPQQLLEWLLEFGAQAPGAVLYPTCDELAWLFSRHREELGRVFRLYQPPLEAVYALLHKGQLQANAQAVGLDVPPTFFPRDEAQLEEVARQVRYPVLLKPQTQIFHALHSKGQQAETPEQLREGFRAACAEDTYSGALHDFDPEATRPMVQQFFTEAAEGIYSISGFIDASGKLVAARAAHKVLQRPRKLGIGLCFDAAEVEPGLAAGLEALAKRVGYYGVFEAEFIRAGGRSLLIDFNPRFYSQMAFDEDRGLSLAQLVHAAACGDGARVQALAEAARTWKAGGRHAYRHGFVLEVTLRAQGLSGRFSA
ncbi:MAG TPA: carbamoyl-phosphate synthase, partial [Aggregicoccus sp.]|nr:carbamoyl-phosphate synthase [Aggregicoccus sp.]